MNIARLNQLSPILNIKNLCREAGVSYQRIIHKLYRFHRNSNHGELKVDEAEKIVTTLKKYGIV